MPLYLLHGAGMEIFFAEKKKEKEKEENLLEKKKVTMGGRIDRQKDR